MRLIAPFLVSLGLWIPAVAHGQDAALAAFNAWCFKAGQTADGIRTRMEQDTSSPLPFDLIFWDLSIEPTTDDVPAGGERRCEVSFSGNHTQQAVQALRKQMATPPVFGAVIPLPTTHTAEPGTVLIEGRELLRGRVAVVHVGQRNNQTFLAVDRLFDGLGLPREG